MSIKIINPASSASSASASAPNLIINGGMQAWQRGTANKSQPAASTAYHADRWAIVNTSNDSITTQRVNGVNDGAYYFLGASFSASATMGNIIFYQVLDNLTSLQLWNSNASLSITVFPSGNVTQVGIQFLYETSETIPTNTIGTEQLFNVIIGENLCQINGQAIGTGATSAGVIGVRIRPTAVSSGNIWDPGNGLLITKGMLTKSNTAVEYQDEPFADTMSKCQRFTTKTYESNTAPGAVTSTGQFVTNLSAFSGSNGVAVNWCLPNVMRAPPTVTLYNASTGASGTWRDSGGGDIAVALNTGSPGDATISIANSGTMVIGRFIQGHAFADAEIY